MRQLTRRQRVAAIVLAAVAVCFVALDLAGGTLRDAHSGVRGTLGSLYRGTDSLLGPARRWLEGVPGAGSSEARIQQLEHDNADLRGRVAALRTDHATSRRVADLQLAADGGDHTVLPARVIAFGPGQGYDWTVTLDVGRTDGVRQGQSVTDGAGLVGRILHADDDTAVVLLAVDPGSGVGARDERTGEIGVVTGTGSAGFTFDPLDPQAVVHAGDRLVTGPSDASTYVAGLSLGTVTAVRSGAGGAPVGVVAPTVTPTQLDLVGVITGTRSGLADRAPLHPQGGTR